MPVGTRTDGGVGLPDLGIEGDGPKGCQWDRSVCVDSPTHFIRWGTHGDDDAELTTSVYCARHYAVELAYYTEFHVHECTGPALEHLLEYGKIL